MPWDFGMLSVNPNMTWEIVSDNLDKKWNFGSMSRMPFITWDIVQDNINKKWDMCNLMTNPNITWNDAMEIREYCINIHNNKYNKHYHLDDDYTPGNFQLGQYYANPNVMKNINDMLSILPEYEYIRNFSHNHLMYNSWFHSQNYKRQTAKKNHDIIYCDLIKKSCTPARLYQWNETAIEIENMMRNIGGY